MQCFSCATAMQLHYITLENYLQWKSNFKDHYGDAVIKQCLGKIAEINAM